MEPTRVDQLLAGKPRAAKLAQATFFASFLGAAKKEGPSGRDMEQFWWQSHQRMPQRQRRSPSLKSTPQEAFSKYCQAPIIYLSTPSGCISLQKQGFSKNRGYTVCAFRGTASKTRIPGLGWGGPRPSPAPAAKEKSTMLFDDHLKDRYCRFTYDPQTDCYDRDWIEYADGTFEPVRTVGKLSEKWEAERTNQLQLVGHPKARPVATIG